MIALEHVWQKSFCHQHGPAQVDTVTSIPFFDGHVLDLTQYGDRRVVDYCVYFAERHKGKVVQISHTRFLTDICLDEEDPIFPKICFQVAFGFSSVLMFDLCNDHVCTQPEQCPLRFITDSSACAGYNDGLAM